MCWPSYFFLHTKLWYLYSSLLQLWILILSAVVCKVVQLGIIYCYITTFSLTLSGLNSLDVCLVVPACGWKLWTVFGKFFSSNSKGGFWENTPTLKQHKSSSGSHWLQVKSDCERQDKSRSLSLWLWWRIETGLLWLKVQASPFLLVLWAWRLTCVMKAHFKNLNILANPATCITGALLQTRSSAKNVSWR